ncbi:SDR family oxidoreductase [Cupriavidus plantarum]|uniref:SDR family oxidoreductase n=1 Tax=Cupriavidus plantarum TaxID=942865 RepID=UPI000EB176D9|nr:SDR family oxidoreductase [Cupriavidus plantarum]RLK31857.1 NAD(P)-dependent dehydrogenase (short-subunit alcohol dehydrogenase family) [Cupriavidus plantarum]
MFASNLFEGQRVLITGGGTGIGASIGRRLVSLGARLIVCGRREAVLAEFAASVEGDVTTYVCDIRDPEAVDGMLTSIWDTGPLDALVNNAAASFIARTEQLSARAADAILGVTMHGAMYCTLGVGRRWIEAGRGGTVLSILSTSIRTGRAFTVPSAMAKSAVQAMTRSLAVEWGPHGIRLVGIAPGPFPTAGAGASLDPTGSRATARLNPLGRVGDHDELANLAAYLLSRHAGYINGEVIAIDGGQHLRTSGAEDLLQWTEAQWQEAAARRGRRA